jgi:hypothetical protein
MGGWLQFGREEVSGKEEEGETEVSAEGVGI